MSTLPNEYNHKEVEARLQKIWGTSGTYSFKNSYKRENNFVIDTPPPTVSGFLHMGHIYSYTQADFIARFKRMSGLDVFYPMGFDDNGLPTERLVEKTKNIRATDLSREDFIKLCNEVAFDARIEFKKLFESIGLSVNWEETYSTISDSSRKMSQMSFLDLYDKEQVYRKLQPMLWDPVDQTAIAQAEIVDKETKTKMNYIQFTCLENSEKIIIATTRPELLGACVAVFYNPEDERYKHLVGKTAITALFGVKVPLLADENVKIDKGTGLVMCCTFGDETDILWWKSHNLKTRILLDKYAKIRAEISDEQVNFIGNDNNCSLNKDNTINLEKAGEIFKAILGLKTTVARDKILELLKNENVLIKQEEITHVVKSAERSGATLEIIPTNQWFVKVLEHKEALKKKANECNWNPDYMRIRIEQWIDGLSWDWCISRQRYFGVPFPIWYSKRAGEEGKILVADINQLPVNPLIDLPLGYSKDEVIPEADVMDTWATSSISPELSSQAINEKYAIDYKRHQSLYPANMRPQAHEIIRTWAFYTIVKSYLHEKSIPWYDLMISGWCLAPDKTKMSKSKGNIVTPVGLIEDKGADVIRYWASTSKLGADTAYSEDVLKIGKKLINKLWNATKFAAIHLNKIEGEIISAKLDIQNGVITETADLWAISKLYTAIEIATKQFEKYEYSLSVQAIEEFFWKIFCDNYLEIVKTRVYGEKENITKAQQLSAAHTIYHCLDTILRLFAPIIPHITEELYGYIFKEKMLKFSGSIHNKNTWPKLEDYTKQKDAEIMGDHLVTILDTVRKIKAEKNLSMKTDLASLKIIKENVNLDFDLTKIAVDLASVTNALDLTEIKSSDMIDTNAIKKITDDNNFTIIVNIA